MDRINEKRDSLRSQIQLEMDAKDEVIETLKRKLSLFMMAFITQAKTVVSLGKSLSVLRKTCRVLSTDLTNTGRTMDEMRQRLDFLIPRSVETWNLMILLSNEIQARNVEIADLERQLEEKSVALCERDQTLTGLTNQVDELNALSIEKEDTITDLRRQIEELNRREN